VRRTVETHRATFLRKWTEKAGINHETERAATTLALGNDPARMMSFSEHRFSSWIEAPVPDQWNPVQALQILGKGTLLTNSPGQLTSLVPHRRRMLVRFP